MVEKFLGKINSGFYFAPYASQMLNGSMTNELKNQTPETANGEYKYDLSGQRYGIQLGWMIGRLTLGMEGSFSNYDYEYSTPTNSSSLKSELSTSLYSVFMMYRGKTWVPSIGMFLSGSAEDNEQNTKLEGAGGITFGIGYKLLEWFQINLDVRSYSFDKYTLDSTEINLPTDDQEKFSATEITLGVSIPIEFGNKNRQKK